MKCKWHKCDKESRTRSDFCSDTCSRRYRRNPDTEPGQAKILQPLIDRAQELLKQEEATPSYENYLKYQPLGMYATRTAPELLNWGAPMSAMELHQAGFKHNRVSIPGDFDYEGVG